MKSSGKALTTIEGFFNNLFQNCRRSRTQGQVWQEIEEVLAALAVLDEMRDLATDQSERLLDVLCSLPNSVDARGYYSCPEELVVSLGEVFGRCCLGPSTYIPKLLEIMRCQEHCRQSASTRALVEISERCEELHEQSGLSGELLVIYVRRTPSDRCGLIRLLGRLGNADIYASFIEQNIVCDCPEIQQECAAASACIRRRHVPRQQQAREVVLTDEGVADGDTGIGHVEGPAVGMVDAMANAEFQSPAVGTSMFDDTSVRRRPIGLPKIPATDWREVPILNGFIHVADVQMGSTKRSWSLPPNM